MKGWSKNIQWIVLGALVMLLATWIWKRFTAPKPKQLTKKKDMSTYLTDENAAVREEAAKLIAKAAMESDDEDSDEDSDEDGELV